MNERRRHVPEWLVERLAANELPAPQAARVREELTAAGQETRLDALSDANRLTLEQHPPAHAAAEIRRRLNATQPSTQPAPLRPTRLTDSLWLVGAAAGAAAVLTALLIPLDATQRGADRAAPLGSGGDVVERDPALDAPRAPNVPETIRLKGLEPRLVVYKQTASGATPLTDGSAVSPGDVIQVAYAAAGYRYGVVLSVDGNHAVTLHLPEAAGPAAPLQTSGEVALSHSFELDATAGLERFLFVASTAPFTTDTVLRAWRAGQPLPPEFVTRELSLKKNTP